jgi:group I intron endonuclease
MGSIYQVICSITGKSYIGQTVNNLEKRKKQHFKSSKKASLYFHRALNKYGQEAFEWIILEKCSESILNQQEQYWIQKLDTLVPKGYNLTLGGEGSRGRKVSSKTREKIGKANGGCNSAWFGKNHTEIEKNKIRIANKHWWDNASKEEKKKRSLSVSQACLGRKIPEEVRNKMSETHKKNPFWLGKRLSENTKNKISENRKKSGCASGEKNPMFGKKHSLKTRKKMVIKAQYRIQKRIYNECIADKLKNCSAYFNGRFCGKHKSQYHSGIIDINGNILRKKRNRWHNE